MFAAQRAMFQTGSKVMFGAVVGGLAAKEATARCMSSAKEVHDHKSWATDEFGNRTFNFGACTTRSSELIFGSERPGCGNEFNKPGAIDPEEVKTWADFMKSNGIKRVLSLLTAEEYEYYSGLGYEQELKQNNGIKTVVMVDVYEPGAAERTLEAVQDAIASKEKLVLHCAGGQGRTGLILAQYLVDADKGFTPEQAELEIMKTAQSLGVNRKVSLKKLEKFRTKGTLG